MGLLSLGFWVSVAAFVLMLIARITGGSWNGGYTWRTVWSSHRYALSFMLAPYFFFGGLALVLGGASLSALSWLFASLM